MCGAKSALLPSMCRARFALLPSMCGAKSTNLLRKWMGEMQTSLRTWKGSHVDFAPRMERGHSCRDQTIANFCQFSKRILLTHLFFWEFIWTMWPLLWIKIFWERVPLKIIDIGGESCIVLRLWWMHKLVMFHKRFGAFRDTWTCKITFVRHTALVYAHCHCDMKLTWYKNIYFLKSLSSDLV